MTPYLALYTFNMLNHSLKKQLYVGLWIFICILHKQTALCQHQHVSTIQQHVPLVNTTIIP